MKNESKETATVTVTGDQTFKKGRHRKKQLYNSILQQMEFYFSDSNLTKDRFLSQLLQQNPYVELYVFLKFNKIRKLTTNTEDIQKAVKNSKLIELSDDKNSIRRKEPVKDKVNVDECTIYVERLKSDATHEWLSSIFSEFGNVVYVSIPKYKHNSAIKGFAFVEFDKEIEAENAIHYFESIGSKMPSNTEPEQLCSISTFEGNTDNEPKENVKKKRKFEEVDEKDDEESPKKIKTETEETPELDDTESKKKKKLKKEHKKKNYIKELGLQVLSKKEWKKMRNRYLDLQKKKMKEFKKHLHRAKFSQNQYEEKSSKSDEKLEKKETEKTLPKYEFEEGLIVKIKLTEPNTEPKKFKKDLKSLSADIMYVDIPNPGSEDVYVRFTNSNSATEFCNQEFSGKKVLLSGIEERTYWDKIQKDRDQKIKKTRKKERGRDKLLKKAKHIKFDE